MIMADSDHQDSSSGLNEDQQPPQTGVFKIASRFIPYFRNPQHVLVFKLDCLLLTWAFLAGYDFSRNSPKQSPTIQHQYRDSS